MRIFILYFMFSKLLLVSSILSSKGLNHNLKMFPAASEIFLLHRSTWFHYLKKKPESLALKAIQRLLIIIIITSCLAAFKPPEFRG